MEYYVNILPTAQLGVAVSMLAQRLGKTVTPSTDVSVIAEQLMQISVLTNTPINLVKPYPVGMLNAVFYWLKFAVEHNANPTQTSF